MKSNSKIKKQVGRKNNSKLVETIILAKKNKAWKDIASILSSPRRKSLDINLGEINEKIKDGQKIIFPGKVLAQGEIKEKIKIVALKFSEKAKEKLLNNKIEFSTISEEIKSNSEKKGLEILK